MTATKKHIRYLSGAIIALCLTPFFTPSLALLTGLLLSFTGKRDETLLPYTSFILKASIVLMGFGMNLDQILKASEKGFVETALSVIFVITMGLLVGKLLKIERKTSLLIASGTAICGGSAIAAVAPIINARNYQISFSLAVIFILNAIALFIFPVIGHFFNLSQETFGYWAAIAIHDTSSVVGAGATYGPKALEVATTVKLIRALWIIPLSIAIALFQKGKNSGGIKWPWFILMFAVAIALAHLMPEWTTTFDHLNWIGRKGMVIALFLIGSNISVKEARKAGWKSFLLGITLWVIIGGSSLAILMAL